MNDLLCYLENSGPAQLLQLILEKSGYLSDLLSSGTEESEDRRNNLQELINAATQYEEETESGDVEGFLSTAALTSDNLSLIHISEPTRRRGISCKVAHSLYNFRRIAFLR